MRFINSIISRYRLFKLNYFHLFPEGKKLKKIKNIHKGKRCFIIGNGPSLKAEDLTIIDKNNDITFAFNRIFYIFPHTPWRPTYYMSQDEKMLKGYETEVEKIPAKYKFIPIELEWYYNIKKISGAYLFHVINAEKTNNNYFSKKIDNHIVLWGTVVYSAIQMAVYMGIKEIYLIGVDHCFKTSRNIKGEIIENPTVQDYFCKEYNKDKDNLWIPNTDETTLIYMKAKQYADKYGIKIYNATRGGKLDVFPRVDFDLLF